MKYKNTLNKEKPEEEFSVIEKPEKKIPVLEKPVLEYPLLEFPVQYIPEEENTDIYNKK